MKFDIQNILQQTKKMQEEMEKLRQEAVKKTITTDSGGGLVEVVMTGNHEIVSMNISKEIINPEEKEILEDLVVAAVNKAIKATQEMFETEMNKISDMMPKIPGLNL